jgi:hypothetical protein
MPQLAIGIDQIGELLSLCVVAGALVGVLYGLWSLAGYFDASCRRGRLRAAVQKYATPEQKERLAAGYLDVEKDGITIIANAVLRPLFAVGFASYPSSDSYSNLWQKANGAVTDEVFKRIQAIKQHLPDARVDFVQGCSGEYAIRVRFTEGIDIIEHYLDANVGI